MFHIHKLAAGDTATESRWDAFVMLCPNATFFHRFGWQQVINRVFRHPTYFLYAELDGEIKGVLPLAHVNSKLFGNALTGLPFAVYGGAAFDDPLAADALEAEAQRLATELGVAHLELRNTSRRHSDWPHQDLYVTFRKTISSDDETNMQAIPRKQRAMVRKGIKNGLVGCIDPNADRFFELFASNVHRHGTPALPKKFFRTLLSQFGPDCEILTIESKEGVAVSSVLSFYFRNEVLPYYAGDAVAARELAANDFKYWELMRRASARGITLFDYGRSKIGSGPYAFKKNWGFEPTPLHYEYCLYKRDAIPQNNPNNVKYKAMIEVWRRLPLSVANWLGPFIVRNLG